MFETINVFFSLFDYIISPFGGDRPFIRRKENMPFTQTCTVPRMVELRNNSMQTDRQTDGRTDARQQVIGEVFNQLKDEFNIIDTK